jgi:L-fuconolactonase
MLHDAIDAHHHLWDIDQAFPVDDLPWLLGAVTYGWKQAGLAALDRSFLLADLEPQLSAAGIVQTILVNALHSMGETRWMLSVAMANPEVAGVVGWVRLTQPTDLVERDLDALASPKLVGVRHLAQFEPDDRWLLRADVLAGLDVVARRRLSYDLLLTPNLLRYIPELSERLPELAMVIDHAAKPNIKDGVLEPWTTDLRRAAANPRVFCKLSGLVTEADHRRWRPDDLRPYVETVLDTFGPDRVMFGSDWPVCTLATTYAGWRTALTDILERSLGRLDPATDQSVFRDTARSFYKLP